ncbi:MAG TPA: hypothetical protein VIK59_07390 [Verrucomicrobiae bacterium]
MQEVWAIIVSAIIVLVIWGIISSKRDSRRLKRAVEEILPAMKHRFEPNRRYNVFLSHGKIFEGVRFLGISTISDLERASHLFPLRQWIILQKESGERIFVQPDSIRYYEEVAGTPNTALEPTPTAP